MPRVIFKTGSKDGGFVRGSRDLTDWEVKELLRGVHNTGMLALPMTDSQLWIYGKNVVADGVIEIDFAWTGEPTPATEEKK